ncbi:ATP-dependent Clp protease adapter ClpS [Tsukamurella spumae]|uniref:ATP-dependent Clp protease adapter protein ClpS n=1 Tax=Tsukamurella spumae TaxID=44753 RepID=A0A846X8E9_9ACTN|nr:ATP-dependent Clp protease adapter ClpS [Tsukamurella spumae]NKY20000.1 ATP-dependent Clp protease adapter ClpS [Tsukamurella spumae]
MTDSSAAAPGSAGGPGGGSTAAQPGTSAVLERRTDEAIDKPWVTVVWDDPVNLMSYVTFVLRKLFGYSTDKAKELMMQVHTEGKAVVSTGDRDKVEGDVRKLHAAGLWATMQRDS